MNPFLSSALLVLVWAGIAIAACVLLVALVTLAARCLRLSPGKAILVVLASLTVAAAVGLFRLNEDHSHIGAEVAWPSGQDPLAMGYSNPIDAPSWIRDSAVARYVLFGALLPLLAIPFATQLVLKWLDGNLSESERRPGMAGVRAWLGGIPTLCLLLALSLCAWQGYGYSFLGMTALVVASLLAYPTMTSFARWLEPAPSAAELSERDRVLGMLESGKINAEECAELLAAIAQAQGRSASTERRHAEHRLALGGLALVAVGFLLPWFRIDLQSVMQRIVGGAPWIGASNISFSGPTPGLPHAVLQVSGGDISHGLGWCILVLGAIGALLPRFAGRIDPSARNAAVLLALAVGAFLLLYLISRNFWSVRIGILLVLAGYALEIAAAVRERQSA